jgi:uncharacterized protein YrrD
VRGLQAEELLGRPVLVRGIRLGRIDDVLFDPDGARVVGFDVLCGDDVHRFLPFAAVALANGGIEVESSLTLLDEETLAFYRTRALALSADDELREVPVGVAGNGAGRC